MMIFQHRDTEIQRPVKKCSQSVHPWTTVLLFILLMAPSVSVGQTESSDGYALYCSDITAKAGSEVLLPIVMKNAASVYALQFVVALPKGVSVPFIEDESGYKRVEIIFSDRINSNKRIINESVYMSEGHADSFGSYGLDGYENEIGWVCASYSSNLLIEPGDGIIAYIPLIIDESMANGDYHCQVTCAIIADANKLSIYPPLTTSTITVVGGTDIENKKLGDVNNDGVVNISDAMCIFSWLLENKPAVFVESAADFNQDNAITVSDGVAIIASILGGQAYL